MSTPYKASPSDEPEEEPLPSSGAQGEGAEASADGAKAATPQSPPMPTFKFSTFILVFLFFLGLWMIISPSTRNQVADLMGSLLYPAFGFGGRYPLATMFCVGILQMCISAVAYNYTTNWVEAAKVQAHAKAIRPYQMKAIKSGKKQHMDALKPHLNDLNTRQSKMMIGQLKGMAVTWFLLIAMYTWVGMFLGAYNLTATCPCTNPGPLYPSVNPNITLFASQHVSLIAPVVGPLDLWFIVFSLYTLPFNLLLRRLFKHKSLSDHLQTITPPAGATPASGP